MRQWPFGGPIDKRSFLWRDPQASTYRLDNPWHVSAHRLPDDRQGIEHRSRELDPTPGGGADLECIGSICLSGDGQVFTWGLDVEGQLGHGAASGHKAVPTKIAAFDAPVSAISCGIGPGGPGHTAAICGGKLYT